MGFEPVFWQKFSGKFSGRKKFSGKLLEST